MAWVLIVVYFQVSLVVPFFNQDSCIAAMNDIKKQSTTLDGSEIISIGCYLRGIGKNN